MAIFNSYVKLPEGTNCPILYQSVMRSGVPYVQSSPPFTDWWIWKASDSHGMEMPWYEDNTPFHCNIYIQYIHFFCLWKPCVHPMIFENLMIGSYLDRNPATAARGKPGDSICILMGWRGLREMSMSMANYNLSPYVDWLVVCNIWIIFPIILAISSSQLTKSYFSEG